MNQILQSVESKLREPDRAAREVEVEAWHVCEVRFMFWMVGKSPDLWKRFSGTVGLSAVGLFGEGGGWGISVTDYTLNTILGGIAEKPVIVDGRIEIRELLNVTVGSDHDIVDDVPAARFTQRFKEMSESGYGLDEGHSRHEKGVSRGRLPIVVFLTRPARSASIAHGPRTSISTVCHVTVSS